MPPSLLPPAPTRGPVSARSLAAPASALEADLFFEQPAVVAKPRSAAVANSNGSVAAFKKPASTGWPTSGADGGFADDDDGLFGDVEAWPPAEPAASTKPSAAATHPAADLFAPPGATGSAVQSAAWPAQASAAEPTSAEQKMGTAQPVGDLFGAPSCSRSDSAATTTPSRLSGGPAAAFDPFRTGRSQQREEVDDDDLFA
jgi:hypothetical protein